MFLSVVFFRLELPELIRTCALSEIFQSLLLPVLLFPIDDKLLALEVLQTSLDFCKPSILKIFIPFLSPTYNLRSCVIDSATGRNNPHDLSKSRCRNSPFTEIRCTQSLQQSATIMFQKESQQIPNGRKGTVSCLFSSPAV